MVSNLKTVDQPNPNKWIQDVSNAFKHNTCPITFRKTVEAQQAHTTKNGQNVRIKTFFAGTLGALPDISTRILRTSVRTGALPLSIPYSVGKSSRYNLKGEVGEELRRTGQEWIDLGVSISCVPVNLCKTLSPTAFGSTVDKVRNYYLERIDAREARDQYVASQIDTYQLHRHKVNEAWASASQIPQH